QCPDWRHGRRSDQPCPRFENLLWFGAIHDVEVERPGLRAERVCVTIFLVELETGAPGVVEKNTCAHALAEHYEPGNRLVDGISRLLPPKRVGVPIGESLIATIERARFVAEAKVMFIVRRLHVNPKRRSVVLDRATRKILNDDVTGIVHDR